MLLAIQLIQYLNWLWHFLLNELTKVEKLSQKVKEKKWNELSINMDDYYHIDTEDKILGILGYGNIGQK